MTHAIGAASATTAVASAGILRTWYVSTDLSIHPSICASHATSAQISSVVVAAVAAKGFG